MLLLAEHFLEDFLPQGAPQAAEADGRGQAPAWRPHAWPGNVRELRNLMERIAYLVPNDTIEADDLAFILFPGGESQSNMATGLELAEATNQFQSRLYPAGDSARRRQHEPSRRTTRPAPLEPLPQDAAARPFGRRGLNPRRRQRFRGGGGSSATHPAPGTQHFICAFGMRLAPAPTPLQMNS